MWLFKSRTLEHIEGKSLFRDHKFIYLFSPLSMLFCFVNIFLFLFLLLRKSMHICTSTRKPNFFFHWHKYWWFICMSIACYDSVKPWGIFPSMTEFQGAGHIFVGTVCHSRWRCNRILSSRERTMRDTVNMLTNFLLSFSSFKFSLKIGLWCFKNPTHCALSLSSLLKGPLETV